MITWTKSKNFIKINKDKYLFYLYIIKNQSDEYKILLIKNIKAELK